jgi:hypothetical protein
MGTTGFIQCSGILVVNNYGPELYANLGFDTATTLLYGAAWLTFALGLNSLASLSNDHYPRNRIMSLGVSFLFATIVLKHPLIETNRF